MNICLGIDPGLARCGWGVVVQDGYSLRAVSYGCIETSAKTAFNKRLLDIYSSLDEIYLNLDLEPDFMSIERLFFGKNVKTAEYVWQARGVVMLWAAQKNLNIIEPEPNQIKLALCGTGGADKTQVQRMVQRFLNLDAVPQPDDTADALAAAITGLAFDGAIK